MDSVEKLIGMSEGYLNGCRGVVKLKRGSVGEWRGFMKIV